MHHATGIVPSREQSPNRLATNPALGPAPEHVAEGGERKDRSQVAGASLGINGLEQGAAFGFAHASEPVRMQPIRVKDFRERHPGIERAIVDLAIHTAVNVTVHALETFG